MPQNKKHHYVARFYLKRFSKDQRSIGIFNVPRRLKIPAGNLKNQCYRDYFYGHDLKLEKALGLMETSVSAIFEEIGRIEAPPKMGSPAHIDLAFFVIVQSYRTAYTADMLDEMNDDLFRHIFTPMAEQEGIDLCEFRIGISNVGGYAVGLAADIFPLVLDLRVKLLVNATGEAFVTSDNPVVMCNQFMSFSRAVSNTGLATKGLQIFFPVDPRVLLVFYDEEVYRVGPDRQDTIRVDDPKDVYEINTLQVASCAENIYFRDPNYDVEPLYRKGSRFRRSRKSFTRVVQRDATELGSRELIATSREDVITDLSLSFVTIRRKAKRWRQSFRKQRIWPLAVPRNEAMIADHDEFREAVRSGSYSRSEFLRFLSDKYDNGGRTGGG